MTQLLVEQLQALANQIEFKNPIKSWLSPVYSFEYDIRTEMIFMRLKIISCDSKSDEPKLIDVFSADTFHISEAKFLLSHPRNFFDRAYRFAWSILEHELQEAFLVNGVHWKDPHPELVKPR